MVRDTRLVQTAVVGDEHSDVPVVLPTELLGEGTSDYTYLTLIRAVEEIKRLQRVGQDNVSRFARVIHVSPGRRAAAAPGRRRGTQVQPGVPDIGQPCRIHTDLVRSHKYPVRSGLRPRHLVSANQHVRVQTGGLQQRPSRAGAVTRKHRQSMTLRAQSIEDVGHPGLRCHLDALKLAVVHLGLRDRERPPDQMFQDDLRSASPIRGDDLAGIDGGSIQRTHRAHERRGQHDGRVHQRSIHVPDKLFDSHSQILGQLASNDPRLAEREGRPLTL